MTIDVVTLSDGGFDVSVSDVGPKGDSAAYQLWVDGVISEPTTEAMEEWMRAQESASFSFIGQFIGNERLIFWNAPDTMQFTGASCSARLRVWATLDAVFTLTRTPANTTDEEPYGTVSFEAGSYVGVVVLDDEVVWGKNDVLQIYAPVLADLTLDTFALALAGD